MLIAGVDIGTTTVCGVLYDGATGQVRRTVTLPNGAALSGVAPWERLQLPEAIYEAACEVLGQLAEGARLDAIGVTGQMHGILYLDGTGRVVSPLYTWQDGRGDLPCGDESGETWAQRLSARTGYPVYTGYGLCTHYWLAEHRALPPTAEKLCTIGDYVAMRLAGLSAPVIDPTNAAALGLYDLEARAFDPAALAQAGADAQFLPRQAAGGALPGRTRAGVPVACALGDNQASFLGAVDAPALEVCANVGTGAQLSAWHEALLPPMEGIDIRPFPGGGYLYVAASLNGGAALEKLAEFFAGAARELGLAVPEKIYPALDRMAEAAGPALKVIPNLYGARGQEGADGAIAGLTAGTFTPGALVRGFYDGMAGELLDMFKALPAPVVRGKTGLVAAGNGLRKNAPLLRRLGAQSPLPVRLCPFSEEAALGAAKYAERACAPG